MGPPSVPHAILTRVHRFPTRGAAALVALTLLAGCSSDDEPTDDPAAAGSTTTTTIAASSFQPITGGTDAEGDPLPPPLHATVSIVVRGDSTWAPYAGQELTGLDVEAAAAVAVRIRQIDELLVAAGVDASFELTYGNAAALCSEDPGIFDELALHGHEVAAHARTRAETFRVERALGECGIVPATVSGLPAIADPVGVAPLTVESLGEAMAILSIQDLHNVVGPVRALCSALGLWAPTNNYGTGADTAPWRSAWRDGAPCEDQSGRPIVLIDQLPVVPDQDEVRLEPDAFEGAATRLNQALGWAADLRYRAPEELPSPGMLTWGVTMRLDDLITPDPDPEDDEEGGDEEGDGDTSSTTATTLTPPVPVDPRTAPLDAATLAALGEWFAQWQPEVEGGQLLWVTPSWIGETLRGT